MDDVTISKYSNTSKNKTAKISGLFTRVLLSIIFVLLSLIYTNISDSNYNFYKQKILMNNIRYTKLKKKYEKFLGKIVPSKKTAMKEVFKKESNYKNIEKVTNGEKIIFDGNTIVEAIQSGIVVFVGKKEDYGNTIIIQGIDDTDIWYSNVSNSDLKLYDYVEKNSVLGEVKDYLLINIIKDNNHILYEEYIKNN